MRVKKSHALIGSADLAFGSERLVRESADKPKQLPEDALRTAAKGYAASLDLIATTDERGQERCGITLVGSRPCALRW